MLKISKYFLGICLILTICSGCTKDQLEFNSEAEYLTYLANPKNGHTLIKEIGDITISVAYLSPAYIHQRFRNIDSTERINSEPNTGFIYNFILNIKSLDVDNSSLSMRSGVKTMQEFKQKVHTMNFEFNDYVSIKVGQEIIEPEVFLLESNIEDQSKLTYMLTFYSKETNKLEDSNNHPIIFSYDDRFFRTGMNHFAFSRATISSANQISFKK